MCNYTGKMVTIISRNFEYKVILTPDRRKIFSTLFLFPVLQPELAHLVIRYEKVSTPRLRHKLAPARAITARLLSVAK